MGVQEIPGHLGIKKIIKTIPGVFWMVRKMICTGIEENLVTLLKKKARTQNLPTSPLGRRRSEKGTKILPKSDPKTSFGDYFCSGWLFLFILIPLPSRIIAFGAPVIPKFKDKSLGNGPANAGEEKTINKCFRSALGPFWVPKWGAYG